MGARGAFDWALERQAGHRPAGINPTFSNRLRLGRRERVDRHLLGPTQALAEQIEIAGEPIVSVPRQGPLALGAVARRQLVPG